MNNRKRIYNSRLVTLCSFQYWNSVCMSRLDALKSLILPEDFFNNNTNRDYFMIGERARFSFTSCEESQTKEWAQRTRGLNVIVHSEWTKIVRANQPWNQKQLVDLWKNPDCRSANACTTKNKHRHRFPTRGETRKIAQKGQSWLGEKVDE